MKFLSVLSFLLIGLTQTSIATTIDVPENYSSIQGAIYEASNGDTIMVASGTYTENICFYGKNIVVTSRYMAENNYDLIFTTIIDGSSPSYSDSASTVRIMHGEDSTAVIEGFTITGGAGTIHPDTDPAYNWREGGGVLVYFANPVVKNNYITKNESVDASGLNGAGGGVSFFKSDNAYLLNNVISYNEGGDYAPGVCIDQAGATIRNNIVGRNYGGETFGGGGLWLLKQGTYPITVENNTVVRNESAKDGAGLWLMDVTVKP